MNPLTTITAISSNRRTVWVALRIVPMVVAVVACLSAAANAQRPEQMPPPNAGQVRPEELRNKPNAEELTLAQCIEIAERYNPVLRRESARIGSASGTELQAGLWSNPKWDTNNPQVIAGRNSLYNAGVQQELPVAGKKRLDRAAAAVGTRQAESNLNLTRYDLYALVRGQFYQTLAAQQRLSLYGRLATLSSRAVETSRDRERAGVGNHIDTLLLNADYERVLAGQEKAEALLQGEREQLAQLLGTPQMSALVVNGRLYDLPPRFDENQLQAFIVGQSELMRMATLEIQKNQLLVRRAEVEWIPNPYLGPAYQFGAQPGSDQLWINLTFPIPVLDRNQGNIISRRADVQLAQANLSTIQLEQLRLSSDLLSRHRAALRQSERYRTHVLPNSREALDLARDGFGKGLIPTASFLQAQRTFVETYLAFIDLQEDVWTTASDLSRLLQMEQFP